MGKIAVGEFRDTIITNADKSQFKKVKYYLTKKKWIAENAIYKSNDVCIFLLVKDLTLPWGYKNIQNYLYAVDIKATRNRILAASKTGDIIESRIDEGNTAFIDRYSFEVKRGLLQPIFEKYLISNREDILTINKTSQ